MIIDCLSDCHGFYPELEGGDLLIVAGDLTSNDQKYQYIIFTEWFLKQDYKKKIIIAGNHDGCIENGEYYFNHDWLGYLCDSGTEFEGLKIWGSPWTKTFEGMNPKCKAFTCDTDEELSEKWSLIPSDIDILITHSPPFGIFDGVDTNPYDDTEFHVGSFSLRDCILNDEILPKLQLHVFGHIHEHGGKMVDLVDLKCVNASYVNEKYKPVNKPVRIVLWHSHQRLNHT